MAVFVAGEMNTTLELLATTRQVVVDVSVVVNSELETYALMRRGSQRLSIKDDSKAQTAFLFKKWVVVLDNLRARIDDLDEEFPSRIVEALEDGLRDITEPLRETMANHPRILVPREAWKIHFHREKATSYSKDVETLLSLLDCGIEIAEKAEELGVEPSAVIDHAPELFETFESLQDNSKDALSASRAESGWLADR